MPWQLALTTTNIKLSWHRRGLGGAVQKGVGEQGLTWCLSRAMAVRVSVETCSEQYCTKRLTWHIAFPKIQVLFTNRT